MTGTSTLYITINNVNEHSPVFTSGAVYAFSFDEDTAPGSAINTVNAPDADSGGADGTVDYIIDSGKTVEFIHSPKKEKDWAIFAQI